MIINPYVYSSALLLDLYPDATVAYSLRKLRTAYTGNCIRVRRTSDNTEQDIGFVNNVLDTSSLLSFCSGTGGAITKWYDQSGNNNNASQTGLSTQNLIVTAGTLIVDATNGKPTSDWSTDNYLLDNNITTVQKYFQLTVFRRTTGGNIITLGNQSSLTPQVLKWSLTSPYNLTSSMNTDQIHNSGNSTLGLYMLTTLRDGSDTIKVWRNNNALTDGTSSNVGSVLNAFGRTNLQYMTGRLQEQVFWNNDQESNRLGIQTNANSFYTVY